MNNNIKNKNNNKNISFAEKELTQFLETSGFENSIIKDFKEEIISIYEKFEPFRKLTNKEQIILYITEVIKYLLFEQSPFELNGNISEWILVDSENQIFQNKKNSDVYYNKKNETSYYTSAIKWNNNGISFTGIVYLDSNFSKLISSSLFIKSFPFRPKIFTINVDRIEISEIEAKEKNIYYYKDDEKCYYFVVSNPEDLKPVFEYYKID